MQGINIIGTPFVLSGVLQLQSVLNQYYMRKPVMFTPLLILLTFLFYDHNREKNTGAMSRQQLRCGKKSSYDMLTAQTKHRNAE